MKLNASDVEMIYAPLIVPDPAPPRPKLGALPHIKLTGTQLKRPESIANDTGPSRAVRVAIATERLSEYVSGLAMRIERSEHYLQSETLTLQTIIANAIKCEAAYGPAYQRAVKAVERSTQLRRAASQRAAIEGSC